MSGWIKLHKSFTSHWLYEKKPFSDREAWIDLLLHANYKPGSKSIKGQLVPYERGQQLRSQVTLSRDWGWSRDRTRRFLKKLVSKEMLIQQNTNLTSIITICNYEEYQGGDTADNTASKTADDTADKTADDTQLRSKEVKKLRSNVNGKKFIKPSVDDIKVYMIEKGSTDQHDKFFDYYESNGWKVGKNPMKCWKAAIRNWLKNNYSIGQAKLEGDYVE